MLGLGEFAWLRAGLLEIEFSGSFKDKKTWTLALISFGDVAVCLIVGNISWGFVRVKKGKLTGIFEKTFEEIKENRKVQRKILKIQMKFKKLKKKYQRKYIYLLKNFSIKTFFKNFP